MQVLPYPQSCFTQTHKHKHTHTHLYAAPGSSAVTHLSNDWIHMIRFRYYHVVLHFEYFSLVNNTMIMLKCCHYFPNPNPYVFQNHMIFFLLRNTRRVYLNVHALLKRKSWTGFPENPSDLAFCTRFDIIRCLPTGRYRNSLLGTRCLSYALIIYYISSRLRKEHNVPGLQSIYCCFSHLWS